MSQEKNILKPMNVQSAQKYPGPIKEFWKYFSENRGAVFGLCIILILLFCAIFADIIAPYHPIADLDPTAFRQPPVWQEGGSWNYLLGTDATGRDMLSRLIHGARISMFLGFVAVTVSLIIGVFMGLTAGYYGGKTESIIMRFTDILLAFPSLLLALAIVAVLGSGFFNTILAISVVIIPHYIRLVRAAAAAEKNRDYVIASKMAGAGHTRIAFLTILPNCMAPIIVQATLGFSTAILDAAALGFLGLGIQPPRPEWGAMLADGRDLINDAWWVITFPGIAILITVIAFNLAGDGLRDALDPKMKR